MRTSSNLPRRALATGVAACAHLIVLLLLGWKIPRLAAPTRTGDDSPAIVVTLVRPPLPRRSEPAPQAAKPVPAPPPAASPAPRVLNVPTPEAPLTSPPKPPPPSAEADIEGDRVRGALRGLLGCTSASIRLTAEEQKACDARLAAAKPAAVGPLYTAKEVEAFDNPRYKDSIFVRKPHNECLPHIGDRPPPANAAVGGAKRTAFGLACEWDFW